MTWKIISTNTFSKEFKKHKKDKEFVNALDNKIKRLKENPYLVGDGLSGNLHGYWSTRIIKNFRVIFKIIDDKKEVHLSAINHRKFKYKDLKL